MGRRSDVPQKALTQQNYGSWTAEDKWLISSTNCVKVTGASRVGTLDVMSVCIRRVAVNTHHEGKMKAYHLTSSRIQFMSIHACCFVDSYHRKVNTNVKCTTAGKANLRKKRRRRRLVIDEDD